MVNHNKSFCYHVLNEGVRYADFSVLIPYTPNGVYRLPVMYYGETNPTYDTFIPIGFNPGTALRITGAVLKMVKYPVEMPDRNFYLNFLIYNEDGLPANKSFHIRAGWLPVEQTIGLLSLPKRKKEKEKLRENFLREGDELEFHIFVFSEFLKVFLNGNHLMDYKASFPPARSFRLYSQGVIRLNSIEWGTMSHVANLDAAEKLCSDRYSGHLLSLESEEEEDFVNWLSSPKLYSVARKHFQADTLGLKMYSPGNLSYIDGTNIEYVKRTYIKDVEVAPGSCFSWIRWLDHVDDRQYEILKLRHCNRSLVTFICKSPYNSRTNKLMVDERRTNSTSSQVHPVVDLDPDSDDVEPLPETVSNNVSASGGEELADLPVESVGLPEKNSELFKVTKTANEAPAPSSESDVRNRVKKSPAAEESVDFSGGFKIPAEDWKVVFIILLCLCVMIGTMVFVCYYGQHEPQPEAEAPEMLDFSGVNESIYQDAEEAVNSNKNTPGPVRTSTVHTREAQFGDQEGGTILLKGPDI